MIEGGGEIPLGANERDMMGAYLLKNTLVYRDVNKIHHKLRRQSNRSLALLRKEKVEVIQLERYGLQQLVFSV